MPLVKYTANRSADDGTGALKISGNRILVLGGEPLEVDAAEAALLNTSFVIEVVEEPSQEEDKDEKVLDVRPSSPAPQTTVTPSPVSVGSTPSEPQPPLPTPPAGN